MSVLRDAKALIEGPKNWMTGALTDGRGRYCARGALAQACGILSDLAISGYSSESQLPVEFSILEGVARQLFPLETRFCAIAVVNVNDELGHDAVMQLYEKAIVETEGGL